MILVRILDEAATHIVYETPVLDAKWERALNKTGEWSFQLPLESALYDILIEGQRAELFYNEIYCVGGKIQDINVNFDLDPVIEVRGRQEIDALYDLEGDAVFFPHAQSFLLQLFTLLDKGGWRLGHYKDIDKTKLVTVDLRKERQLLTQIAAFLKQDATLFYRYGGTDYAGQKLLDVGFFDDPYLHTVLNASPGEQSNAVVISSVKSRDTFTNRIYAGRAIGGQYRYLHPDDTAVRTWTLESDAAIDANPLLAYDPDYPIYEEIVSVSYVVIPTSIGDIGGRQYCRHQSATSNPAIGALVAATNYWAQFVFKPPPGRLTEVSFWIDTVVNEGTLKSTNTLAWELCDVIPATKHIPGTLLQSGTIADTNWTAGARCRVTFDEPLLITYDKQYMFRVGFETAPATGNYINLFYLSTSNNARTMRQSRSSSRAGGYEALNWQPTFEAITVGVGDPPRGRRAFLENPRIVPQQADEASSTVQEIEDASVTLYEWLVEQIKASDVPLRELPVTLAGFDLSWQPGDNVLLQAQIQFPDGARQASETRTIESLAFSFSGQQPSMEVKFTPNTPLELPDDAEIALWDQTQLRDELRFGQYIENPKEWQRSELTVAISGRSPDAQLSDGTPAIMITFNVPTPPIGFYETRLLGTPYLIHTTDTVPLVVELISKPPGALVILAAIKNIGWRPTDVATAYADIVWR